MKHEIFPMTISDNLRCSTNTHSKSPTPSHFFRSSWSSLSLSNDMVEKDLLSMSTIAQFQSRNYASLAALICVFVDYFSTLRFEYRNIWTDPFGHVNLMYIASRYLGLIPQITHYALIHTHLANPPVSESTCKVWIISLLANAALLLLLLDAVLFLRIYALYQKRRYTLWILVPIVAQPLLMARAMRRVLRDSTLDGLCNLEGSMFNATSICSTVLFTHLVLWLATFLRRNIAQGRAVVVKLVVQEITWALVLLFALLCATAPYASIKDHISPFFALAWGVTFLSITCCRLIMNIRQLQVERNSRGDTDDHFVLTTIITSATSLNSDLECSISTEGGEYPSTESR